MTEKYEYCSTAPRTFVQDWSKHLRLSVRTKNAQYFCCFQICCWRENIKQDWNTRYRQQSVLNSTKHATRDYTAVKCFLGAACTPFLVSLSFLYFPPDETLTSRFVNYWWGFKSIRTLTYAIFRWMHAVLLTSVDLITRVPLSFLENVRKDVVSRWVTELCCSVTFAFATPKN